MTRKDYELIARAIAATRQQVLDGASKPTQRQPSSLELLGTVAHNLAEALNADNPRFDYTRFVESCVR